VENKQTEKWWKENIIDKQIYHRSQVKEIVKFALKVPQSKAIKLLKRVVLYDENNAHCTDWKHLIDEIKAHIK